MARSFREIGKKAEDLLEQGREADQKLAGCQARVAAARRQVTAAQNRLAEAQRTDENGNASGNVEQAQAQLRMAENQLAASERACAAAGQTAANVRTQKSSHAAEIKRHNDVERANLEKLRRLATGPFGTEQAAASREIAGRLNEAEDARVSLLKSMGIEAKAEYAALPDEGISGSPWTYGSYGALMEGFPDVAAPGSPVSWSVGPGSAAKGGYPGNPGGMPGGDAILPGGPGNAAGSALPEAETNVDSRRQEERAGEPGQTAGDGGGPENQGRPQAEDAEYDPPKVLKLSDQERYEMGLRYIDNIIEVYRDNLRDRGVPDGEAMEIVMAGMRIGLMQRLGRDFEEGTYRFYNYPEPDYERLTGQIQQVAAVLPSAQREAAASQGAAAQREAASQGAAAQQNEAAQQEAARQRSEAALAERARQQELARARETFRAGVRCGSVTERDVRRAGSALRERYDALIGQRNADWDRISQSQRALAAAYREAKTPEERERMEMQRKLLMQQENLYHETYNHMAMMTAVLREHRRLGPDETSVGQSFRHEKGLGASKTIRAINEVREFLPSEWVEKSDAKPISARHRSRGYFLVGEKQDVIALSGTGSDAVRCAFHEMGHRFEQLYPEILALEKQFYERRTQGEKAKWLGWGYGIGERARFDQFVSPYMGKDYGGRGYELFSMGMEAMFCGSYSLARDTEYQDFIFGILAMI